MSTKPHEVHIDVKLKYEACMCFIDIIYFDVEDYEEVRL